MRDRGRVRLVGPLKTWEKNMTPKALVSVGIASFLLLACTNDSPSGGGTVATECNPNQCKITVKVANNCNSANDITVDVPTMSVPKRHKQIKMHWEFDAQSSGFKFAREPNGITFTTAPQPPPDEFHDPDATAGDTKYSLTNANTPETPTEYKYNIQVLRADGSSCPRKDPVIRNGA
jgi:hypothetical protein